MYCQETTRQNSTTQVTLPKLPRSVYATAVAHQATNGSGTKEQYPGVVITQRVVSAGIELPIPYQVIFQDHIQSRLEPFAMDKIVTKSGQNCTQPSVLHKPKPRVPAQQAQLVQMALTKMLTSQAPFAAREAKETDASPANTPSSTPTGDTFTQQATAASTDSAPDGNDQGIIHIKIGEQPQQPNSNSEQSKKKLKKDALWKPLLRGFRTFLRRLIKFNFDTSQRMFHPNGNLKRKAKKACQSFLKEINVPQEYFANQYYYHALAVTLAPVSGCNLEKFFEDIPAVLKNISKVKATYCTIYRENSVKLRQQFFSDEFIQMLWAKYTSADSASIASYLKQLDESGHRELLLSDIRDVSDQTQFDVLPADRLG